MEVDEGPAAIAGIDGCVGLDELLVPHHADTAILGADDARGHGVLKTKRLAECEHPIADLHLVAIAQLGERQRAIGLNADDGDVGVRVGLDVGRDELAAVVQFDGDLAAAGDHVVIGQDDARRIDDYAAARALLGHPGHLLEAFEALEPFDAGRAFEELLEKRIELAKFLGQLPSAEGLWLIGLAAAGLIGLVAAWIHFAFDHLRLRFILNGDHGRHDALGRSTECTGERVGMGH